MIEERKNVSDVNVVRVSSERRLADVQTNDSDVPPSSASMDREDEMQIHLSSERRLDDVALLSESRSFLSPIPLKKVNFEITGTHFEITGTH